VRISLIGGAKNSARRGRGLLDQLTAPVLSRSVRVLSPLRLRTYRNCGYDRGFAPSFGDATPTARLKTGAGQFKRLATHGRAEFFAPPIRASSPTRPFAPTSPSCDQFLWI
jgi:hypothetical protein